MFPKDYLIVKETLIHLWIANDLISSKGNMEVEEIGKKICKELYLRSFFHDAMNEGLDFFKMHDLVHDLAQSIMDDECRVIENDRLANLSRVRHLTLSYSDPPFDMLSALFKADSLRTVMLLSSVKKIEAHKFPHGLYFRSLRAFDAGWTNLTNIELSCLLSLIVGSKHLRYLNLSGTMIRFLPESICSLQSLQTLDVSNCRDLEKLPEHMSRIRSLRHLYIEGCPLNHIPPNIGKLSCLRSLCRFIVNRRRGCGIDELGSLLNLEGRVRIEHLEKVKSPTEAKKANLAGKMNLKRLTLEWGLNESTESYKKKTAQVLEALEPPPGLEFLRIDSFSGMRFPGWFSNNDAIFQNLDSIEFFDCKNCSELPTGMGKLPSLTYLGMYRMDCLRYVDDESESFGTGELEGAGYLQLQKLRISCLTSLERLSRSRMERRDIFPRLSSLNIEGCPKLTSLHCLQSIRELSIKGCSETVLESVSNLHTLTSLEIWNNDDLASFPDGFLHNLTALKSLKISRFTKLQDLQSDMLIGLTALEELSISSCDMFECFSTGTYRGLISLKNMQIVNCRKLKSLSDNFGDLPALESLRISKCPELETFPNGLNNLSSLQRLTLSESKLTALPENLQHLPALKGMRISGFPNLEKLPDWLGDLTSLSSLYIISCPKLEYLPTSIQYLTNLQSLNITNCPKLEERCKKEIGEDWHKIAHVPRINVR
ncbi:putative disease resistance protein RGA4 [Ziziphus jujuba]|uniref:Disease resistance protein RGA4 n=1 Tax=Ziziphus jujuba TaxID=326968 RepID=A0A6P4AQF5_ZIZJJ|nr:putative disease resistance protein RGA4 [Ziziphus jujuba]XP_015897581.3 putative disease resistance protein RGA4 [Ziziphus jujuba]